MSHFRERRGSSFATLVIAVAIPVSIYWVLLATDSILLASSAAVASGLTVFVIVWRKAAESVEVNEAEIRVGAARLEHEWISDPQVYLGEKWETALREAGQHRSWLSIRTFHPGGVRVKNRDPRDEVEYWFVSSRKPIALRDAIVETGKSDATTSDRTELDG